MNHFIYQDNELYCEGVPLEKIAREVGTPVFIYSHATLERHYTVFDQAFRHRPHHTHFAMKALDNIAILRLFARLGAGVDIVSGGELFRAQKAGVPPERIVFSGVGKTSREMQEALEAGIHMFNVESSPELDVLSKVATDMGVTARISLRVNPAVDPKTFPYVATGLKKSKFGIAHDNAYDEYLRAADLPGLEIAGIDCHIGSQITQTGPFMDAANRLMDLMRKLTDAGINLKYLDMGGGLGIQYNGEEPPNPAAYAEVLDQAIPDTGLTLLLEPGRVIVGNAGVLVGQVLYNKIGSTRHFVIVDTAMNDLIRPCLYNAYHAILPVKKEERETITADVVGPVCESSDFLAREREMPAVLPGEYLAVMSAGAYAFTMSSNYNARRRAPEILVKGDEYFVIRERENYNDLISGEEIPAFLRGE